MNQVSFVLCVVLALWLRPVTPTKPFPPTQPIQDPKNDTYSASCHAWGDPHFKTFDGQHFKFQGDCEYTLVNDVARGINIVIDTELCGNWKVSCIVKVTIIIDGVGTFIIVKGGAVTKDGVAVTYPHNAAGVEIKKKKYHGKYAIILRWDGYVIIFHYYRHCKVWIDVKNRRRDGTLKGLCGNYNGFRGEYVMKNGLQASSVWAYGVSWKTDDTCVENTNVHGYPRS